MRIWSFAATPQPQETDGPGLARQTARRAAQSVSPLGTAPGSRKSYGGAAILLALSLTGSGCVVGRAAGAYSEIPRERTTECMEICTKLDLQMSAVVVVLNTTGCVCEPRTARAPAAPGVSSLSAPAEQMSRNPAQAGGAAVAAAHVVARVTAQQQQRILR